MKTVLSLTVKVLFLLHILLVAQTATVTGAGTTEVNGVYVYNSTDDAYYFGDYIIYYGYLFSPPDKWHITKAGLGFDYYSNSSTSSTPPETGWVVETYGSSPAPTVTYSSLPVELLSFSAKVNSDNVILNWRTATEKNNFGFEIERKSVGNWGKIGFVKGAGNSNSPKEYSYVDNVPESGKYSYRLKQIDLDGSYEYSNIVEVNIGAPENFELMQNYPNPFNPVTTINYSIPKLKGVETRVLASLRVYNILGEEVATLVNKKQAPGNYSVQFDASNLPSGVYFYALRFGNFTATKKMTLLK